MRSRNGYLMVTQERAQPMFACSKGGGYEQLNLYELYRNAVLGDLNQTGLSSQQVQAYDVELRAIRQGFGGSVPISYASEYRRRAYSLVYGPKHAIIWREYVIRSPLPSMPIAKMNSIGTGSASEIIGFMEGLRAHGVQHVDWRSFDTEPGWWQLASRVINDYATNGGLSLTVQPVGAVNQLWPQAFTIGSFVLSEIVKQNGHRAFRPSVKAAIGPTDGWFLDIPMVRLEDRSEPWLGDFFGFGREGLRKKDWNLRGLINGEMAACNPTWCALQEPSEPSMLMYFANFR